MSAKDSVFDFLGNAYKDIKEYAQESVSAKYEVEKARAENATAPVNQTVLPTVNSNYMMIGGGLIFLLVIILLLKK